MAPPCADVTGACHRRKRSGVGSSCSMTAARCSELLIMPAPVSDASMIAGGIRAPLPGSSYPLAA